jgi:hypothetical protein
MPQIQPTVSALAATTSLGVPSFLFANVASGGSETAGVSSINSLTGNVSIVGVPPTTAITIFDVVTLLNNNVLDLSAGTGMTVSSVAGAYTVNKLAGGLTYQTNTNLGAFTGSQNGTSALFTSPSQNFPPGTYQLNWSVNIPFTCLTYSTNTLVLQYSTDDGLVGAFQNQPLALQNLTGGVTGFNSFTGILSAVLVITGASSVLRTQLQFTNANFLNGTGSSASLSWIKLS